MTLARVLTAAAGCVVLGAAVAACSGSFGSGSGMPSTMATPNFGQGSSPAPPANQSSSILTYGESTAFQELPTVGGYGGAIAFPKAPEPTVAPAGKNDKNKNASPPAAPTPVAVSIGVTLSIVKPQDGPDLNFSSGKGKRKKSREHPARALAYVTLLPTHDVTLESYPRFALDVPREIASQYRDGEFGLAMWNAGEKDSRYRLAVAELDTVSTPPPMIARTMAPLAGASPGGSAKPAASGSPTATPSPSSATRVAGGLAPGGPTGPVASPGAAGSIGPTVAPTLPPQRLLFASTATTLKLVANRPAVFALYALPHPSSASAAPKAAPAPKASDAAAASSVTSAPPTAAPAPAPPVKPTATPFPSAPGKTP